MDKINFEWDTNKSLINIEKHGITFEEASTVFADEEAILFDDPEHSEDEERFLPIGLSNQARTLLVCHCYRENDSVIRIIFARKATKNETKIFVEHSSGWC